MSEEKSLAVVEQRAVEFYGDELVAVLVEEGSVYVPIRPICDNLGITLAGQRERIGRDPVLSKAVSSVSLTLSQQARAMLCLPLNLLPNWLSGINIMRIRSEIRPKLERFRREAPHIFIDMFGENLDSKTRRALITWTSTTAFGVSVKLRKAYIYLIQAVESDGTLHYKIGYTSQTPETYSKRLAGRSPIPLWLEHSIYASEPVARRLEAQLHRKYEQQRTHHEWFQLTPAQVAEVKQL